jgi:positive regulator of sigma E activity
VAAQDDFRPGQAVRVGVRERDLLRAAGVLYGLPLFSFILAAVLAATFFDQALIRDVGALAAGLAGAGVSLWLIGRLRPRLLNPCLESLSASPGCDELESADN